MAQAPSSSQRPAALVRLEVRVGAARSAVYEVGDGGFLVGSVPGCDLRLPGANLAPVLCLIARQPSGASLRKLAPVQPLSVNGRTVTSAYLQDGDRVTMGPAELTVSISGAVEPEGPASAGVSPAELIERVKLIEAREQQLQARTEELETDRVIWYRRRDEIEAECRRQMQRLQDLAASRQKERGSGGSKGDMEAREQALRAGQEELTRRTAELDGRIQELSRQEEEVASLRGEMGRIRQQLAARYQHRRDRLIAQQQALRRAARKVIDRKRQADEQEARLKAAQEEWALKLVEYEAAGEQVARERQMLEEQHRLLGSRQQEQQRDLAVRLEDLVAREQKVAEDKAALEKGQKQHQSDLVRLDRIQAGIEQRQKALGARALEIDKKFEQLQRDTRDLEEQAAQMDDWHNRLTAESERLEAQKKEQAASAGQIDQRAAALEGQQAMLATLRTRLERMREELRRQEQALSDQRALQEASEADLKGRLEEAEKLRGDLANDKQLFDEERRRFDERRVTLDQAVAQLRQAQESLEAEQAELRERQASLDATASEQGEQAGLLLARAAQLEQLHQRLVADRQTLRDREATLSKAEQTLGSLQEQVRVRSEELNQRQKQVEEKEGQLARRTAETEARLAQTEQVLQQSAQELEGVRQELETRTSALVERAHQLDARSEVLQTGAQDLEEQKLSVGSQRQALASDRLAWEVERQAALEQERQARAEFAQARQEAQDLTRQLPELELRAGAALERLGRAREHLREHLAEVHAYARQSREDLETARQQVQGEVERVRQRELELQVARDEHRLAVAAFRQQLIEWQGKVGEMRQALRLGTSQLELRQADLEKQARAIADTSARLAVEEQELQRQQRQVAERRGEVDRHLNDMQEWYRRKLRELAGVDPPAEDSPGEGDVVAMPAAEPGAQGQGASGPDDRSPARAVLTLTDEVEPADRQLGELLATLGLVDQDTLHALWAEARRKRRSLRQLLLATGNLTLHQVALIEAGNLDALVLGPVSVIDKLPSTSREAVYRVHDPRRKCEALLRHLAESEMHDAVRPDEFEQRFAAAAAVQHGNVAAVLEVLKVAGRPAALLEWVHGLPGSDWPGLVAAPGVWYRLVSQAAMAIQAAHSAGLCHGHLDAGSFVLTPTGAVKLVGLGEPRWLAGASGDEEAESATGDLLALGRAAAAWAAAAPSTGKSKPKPLPEDLQAILLRLQSADGPGRYASAQELIEDLERASAKAPSSTAAWERLLRQVREQAAPPGLRESA
jgi:chromosome segregation ATPase